VFIKCSEPDAFSLAQISSLTAGLFRRGIPEIIAAPRLPAPPGHFLAKTVIFALVAYPQNVVLFICAGFQEYVVYPVCPKREYQR
jgi:hypothetical protein